MNSPKTPQPLTTKQRHVLLYLRTFLNHNHCLPPAVCIAGAFGWRSANSAALHLKALEKKGYLQRNELGGLMLAGEALCAAAAAVVLVQRMKEAA